VTVCLIDTSVFCEVLRVPHMDSDAAQIRQELEAKLKARESLMLPMTSILETGNHIGQNGNGALRRETALRFVEQVRSAIGGKSPFTATSFVERGKMLEWLDGFPDWTMRSDARGKGSGLGDLTIQREWLDLCEKFPGRRVYIWSKDGQLAGYDREP
jgi:hypothetical protein